MIGVKNTWLDFFWKDTQIFADICFMQPPQGKKLSTEQHIIFMCILNIPEISKNVS